jgi:Zn-finger nucleic acid-binding protein
VRLIACKKCHVQYDVSSVDASHITCRCGAEIANAVPEPVDVPVQRCSSCGAALAAGSGVCSYCDSVVEREPGKLSLICPECYARNQENSRFCAGCGVAFTPQPIVAAGAVFPCPSCARPMQGRGIGDLGVHECLYCHGLWVPGESFDTLVSRAIESWQAATAAELPLVRRRRPRGAPFSDQVVYRRCPVCHTPMHRKNFGRASGVIVDWCGEHGTWLDADELGAIAEFILSGRGAQAAAAAGDATAAALRLPTAGQVKAFAAAEELMADEKAKSHERWERVFDRHAGRRRRFSPVDLLELLVKVAVQ